MLLSQRLLQIPRPFQKKMLIKNMSTEKVYQRSHKIPLELLCRGMKKKVNEFTKKYSKSLEKYDIKYCWISSENTLSIKNRQFDIQVTIIFSEGLVTCYASIPFYLRAIGSSHIKKVLKIIIREIDIYLKSFNSSTC